MSALGVDGGGVLAGVPQQLADLRQRRAFGEQVAPQRVPEPVRPEPGDPARAHARATISGTASAPSPLNGASMVTNTRREAVRGRPCRK